MGPDGKAQVTIEYSDVNEPVRISNVICSTQHSEDLKDNPEEVQKRVEEIIKPELDDMTDDDTIFKVNPTGNFITGGPDGDTGVTGRKLLLIHMVAMLLMEEEPLAVKTVLRWIEVEHTWQDI